MMREPSLGIERCRYEALVLGEWIRARQRARVWRCAEMRLLICWRWLGRDAQRGEDERSARVCGVGEGVERCEERRRMSSMSSAGRAAALVCVARTWGAGLSREVVVVVVDALGWGERSIVLSADLRRCIFAARMRAVFNACEAHR